MESAQNVNMETNTNNDTITLKDVVALIGGWLRYIWKKKIIVISVVVVGMGLGLLKAYLSKPTYSASLTFLIEDGQSSSLGAYSGIAAQFGIDLGGGDSKGVFQDNNISGFLTSRMMLEKTLRTPIKVGDKIISMADFFLDFSGIRNAWHKSKKQPGFDVNFPPALLREKYSRTQDSVLNVIQTFIGDNYLKIEKADKKSAFILVNCKSPNETFSKLFVETLVREATDFYISTKTKRTKSNVDRLESQADSMKLLLNRKAYSQAVERDINLNPAKQVALVGTELAARDKMMLETMYGEIVKNLEISKMAMTKEMPIIQIIDAPVLPLEKKELGKLKGIIIGGFLGGFLSVAILIIIKLFKDLNIK